MTLIRMQDVELSVGRPHPLLEDVELTLGEGERVCVLGRNGAGKSTLLRLLAGELEPDAGTVKRRRGLRVTRLPQEVPVGTAGRVFEVVAQAVGSVGELLAAFHRLSHAAEAPGAMEEMGRVQAALDAEGGWDAERRVDEVLTRLDLDPEADFATLSGGMKRRVLLAQSLAGAPDVLLLDEPTNHLDIENITWLEGFLREFGGCVVFVTHDRSFLRALATRILEIDRGRVTSWPGDYDAYLRRRDERLHAEAKDRARLDAKLAQEEAWIRQGIKARRTRNMGRVRELQALREAAASRREQEGRVRLEAADAGRSGKRVIQAKHVSFAWEGRPIVRDFSTTVLRRDRIGIVGRNGSGKTTLLRLLLGDLAPQEGTVQAGTKLEVAYFDQQRARLDEGATLAENLSGGKEYVELGEGRRKHVMSYLRDFLFTPDRARTPITELSGGERSRLLLALLFSRPSNVLVMDEPTNDLDLETLELLEELVADYEGTLLLVSHDRTFLDHTVTRLFVLEGDGRVDEEAGGYSDWVERKRRRAAAAAAPNTAAGAARISPAAARKPKPAPAPRALGTKERRELEALPERIEQLEARVAALGETLGDPSLWQGDRGQGDRDAPRADPRALQGELAAVQAELEEAYRRWEELEARSPGGALG